MAYTASDDEKGKAKDKIQSLISQLTDENFGNEEQRKKFASRVYSLVNSKDPAARKVIKYLGDMMSDYSESRPRYKSIYSE